MKLQNIIITTIVISMIVLGTTAFLTDLGSNYGESADFDKFNGTRARLQEQQGLASGLSDEVHKLTLIENVGIFETPYRMIQTGWKTTKLIVGSWVTVGNMTQEGVQAMEDSGVPLSSADWLLGSIIAIIIILVVVMLIYSFFKWKFET